MAIKKKWSTMKRLSEKEKEQPINLEKLRYRDPRPTICLDSDNLPEIKNWEVGKEYNANGILKVDGKADNIDEETVDENITEYSDDGLDCFVFFEDLKQLYIIQNKFYGETTKLDFKYVQNEFLNKPISTLINNNYKRSRNLQDIFNKYRNDSDCRL